MELKTVIVIDNSSYPFGGTAQVAFISALELKRRGYEVVYVSTDKSPNPALTEKGIRVECLDNLGIRDNPNRLEAAANGIWNADIGSKVKRILQHYDSQSTIIHIHGYLHTFSPSILKVCSQSGKKVILTLHDYFTLCPCGGFYDYKSKKVCNKSPMSLKCILCNCDKRNYPQKIWRVIRQVGVNKWLTNNKKIALAYISEFSYSKMKERVEKRHKTFYVRNPYDLGENFVYKAENNFDYVFLGRLSEEKGADLFCRTFVRLLKNGKVRGKAIVVGDGELKEKLENNYPEITFVGWKTHDEMPEIMKTARALVFPSRWYEGAPLTPIEFMAHGIPCIVSDACAATEYVKDDSNGLIFQSENEDALIDSVLKAEDDRKWSSVAAELRNSFDRMQYSVSAHCDRLIEVYNMILCGGQTY